MEAQNKIAMPAPTEIFFTATAESPKEVDHFLSLGMEPYAVTIFPNLQKIQIAGAAPSIIERTYFKRKVTLQDIPKEKSELV